MALVHCDPFAFYTTAQLLRVYTSSTATATIGATGPNSVGAVRFTGDVAANIRLDSLTTSGDTFIIGFDFRFSALPGVTNTIFNMLDSGTIHVAVSMHTDGTLRAYRGNQVTLLGSSAGALSVDTWYHINARIVINDTTGSVTVNVHDGTSSTTFLSITSQDTKNSANATWNQFSIGGVNSAGTSDVANLIVQDGSGSRLSTMLGPVDVLPLWADARATPTVNDFTLSTGSSVPALLDDTTSDDDTTYVSAAAADLRQTTFVDVLSDPEFGALGMQLYALARAVSGSPTIKGLVRQGANNFLTANKTLTTSYDSYLMQPYSAMPDGSVPSFAAFNALQWGAMVTAAAGGVRLTQVAVAVILDRSELSSRNLLTGDTHTAEGSDNVIAGMQGTVTGNRVAMLNMKDSDPYSYVGDNAIILRADYIEINGEVFSGGSPGGSPGSGTNLDDLDDVNAPSPDDGDVLTWDDGAGEWIAAPPESGAGWPIPAFTPPVDGDFAWINQGSASVTSSIGGLFLRGPAGGSLNWRIRKKSAPSTPYTVTVAFFAHVVGDSTQQAGIGWRQSSDGKLVWFGVQNTGIFNVAKYTNATTLSAGYANADNDASTIKSPMAFLRIADDGSNRICSYSADGANFIQYHSIGRTDFLTGDEVFFAVNTQNSGVDVGMTLMSWEEA